MDTSKDISEFCWAVDDEVGLVAVFENDGEHILSTVASTDTEPMPYGERYIKSYTIEGNYTLVLEE